MSEKTELERLRDDAEAGIAALRAYVDAGGNLSEALASSLREIVDRASDLPDELIITPKAPIKVGEAEFPQLILKEPTAFHLTQADPLNGHAYDVMLITLVSGWPKAAVEKLGARDMLRAARYLGRFLA